MSWIDDRWDSHVDDIILANQRHALWLQEKQDYKTKQIERELLGCTSSSRTAKKLEA